eukprot:9294666-Alexandrium_andersonii.AAC.1
MGSTASELPGVRCPEYGAPHEASWSSAIKLRSHAPQKAALAPTELKGRSPLSHSGMQRASNPSSANKPQRRPASPAACVPSPNHIRTRTSGLGQWRSGGC